MARSGPQAVQIILSDSERDQLTQLAVGSSKLAWRARLVLACAEPGSSNAGVAAAMGATPDTVRKWRSRFADSGLAGLADEARSGRPKAELTLDDDERAALTRWARRAGSAQALAQRSKVVLACAEGASNAEVAARLGVGAHMVAKWRRRFNEFRLEGLIDEPRAGRPPTITDDQVEQVVVDTLESTPTGATHWSRASMAKRSGLSPSTVGRIWKAFRLKPHRAQTFKLSKDPLFIEKVHDVVGLYLNPPEHAVVLCADEKSQVQALDRSQPVLPMMPVRCQTDSGQSAT